ncbi:Zn peptidase [Mannheimia varigena]|uniref:ImmA/IrrE family metallo-endopeptidase n=1 Tax=Mannheimia varigena TaxID=85404 RepID=UPI00159D9AE6|nr:ImmA/IrrE family metallo-endopeptidase [Mannheimia varigena]QLB17261.1 Zn peptidase [Mannheimia varigena]
MELQISPNIIHWIAALEHIEPQTLADELAPNKAEKFLTGLISKTTALALAKRANIPFGYLFLNKPPKIEQPHIPDLRQVIGSEPLSKDFFDVLKDIENKQDWFKDYLIEQGNEEELPFVGKFQLTINLEPKTVAKDIEKTLGINLIQELKYLTKDTYFKYLTEKFEHIGILVFKNGIVKNNTRKTLNTSEFRGFALVDKIVPVVFINGSDVAEAQTFTLLHEVAHIWIGVEGVSSWNQDQTVEAFCNRVAAEFLMPTELFIQLWQDKLTKNENIEKLASYFKVSKFAVIVKAVTLSLLENNEIHKERERLKTILKQKSNGGDFHNILKVRQSPRFCSVVINQAISQNLPLREASRLLNIKKVDTLISHYRRSQGVR